jgi:hypothetical protein
VLTFNDSEMLSLGNPVMSAPKLQIKATENDISIRAGSRALLISKVAFRKAFEHIDPTEPPDTVVVKNEPHADVGFQFVVSRYVITSNGESLSISKSIIEMIRNRVLVDESAVFELNFGGSCCY